jgi:hypothetical protein
MPASGDSLKPQEPNALVAFLGITQTSTSTAKSPSISAVTGSKIFVDNSLILSLHATGTCA